MNTNALRISIWTLLAAVGGVAMRPAERARSEDAEFKPIVEAEMPAGFPSPTPVGEVRVKTYPAYRRAETKMGVTAFWSLFAHIKKNDVAMTAPVEMTYDDANADRPRETAMAFLYGRPDLGKPAPGGSVAVVDVPAMTTVSTGVRGPRTDAAVTKARDRLLDWLKTNKNRYESAGPLRVMAYNSPFVAKDKNFFEVEIPIRPTAAPDAKR